MVDCTVEPGLKGPCNERPPSVLRPEDFLIVYNKCYCTSELNPPAFCDHFNCAKGVALQGRFDCTIISMVTILKNKYESHDLLYLILSLINLLDLIIDF